MPYSKHKLFVDPKDENLMLWRYMDFEKFVSLISRSSLFFTCAIKLRELDKHEGSSTQKELDFYLNYFKELQGSYCTEDYLQKKAVAKRKDFEEQRNTNFINCWHLDKTESMALWKIYAGNNNGVVIQTRISSFKESFKSYEKPVFIGEVKYIDYDNQIYEDVFKNGNPYYNGFYRFLTKHNGYKFEKEYRALVQDNEKNIYNGRLNINGIFIPINLNLLIEKIFIAPNSPNWYYDLVKEMLEKYGVKKEVLFSSLDKNPPDFKI